MITVTTFELNMNDSFKIWLLVIETDFICCSFSKKNDNQILLSGFLTTLKHHFDIYGQKNMYKCTILLINLQNGTYTHNYLQV